MIIQVVKCYPSTAPGFLPSDFGSLQAWYDADNLAGADGSVVTTFTDRTGAFNATDGSSQANLIYNRLNGRKGVVLDAGSAETTEFTMSSSLMSGATAGCFFAVFLASDPPLFEQLCGAPLDAFTNNTGGTKATHTPYMDGIFYEHFGTDTRKTLGNPTPSFTSPRIYSVHSGANDFRTYIDGTNFTTTGTNTVNFGTKTRNLGWSDAGVTAYLSCDMFEILIFNEVLSTGNREKVEGYLAHKWGLAGNLPGGHTYKVTPP